MAEITDIIRGLVAEIDTTITGTFNAGMGTTDYCKTKWSRVGKIITDSVGNTYLIDEVLPDVSLETTQQNTPPTSLTGVTNLNPPFFQTGTKLAANLEWTKVLTDLTAKTPLIWLLEIIREQKFGREDVREFETELRIFFLDETDPTQYVTEDNRREIVLPMEQLAESFLDVVRSKRVFKTLENYKIITFSRFGVETDQGVIQNILDANLSGVELQFTLTKYKENCKVC